MTYLVTGGAGFIGSHIVEALVRRGETIRVLDNFSTGKRENLAGFAGRFDLIEGDIRSYHIVREAVEGVDIVLHQGALPSVPRSIRDPITTNEVNVIGTLNLLDAARDAKVKRVVFASSSSVYGDSDILPKHEGMALSPLSPYSVSKLAGEKYCTVFSRIYGLHTIALRYFNVFGPRQDPQSQYSAVIPRFISSILNDLSPEIYGDGQQSRDFTYVENVVEANLLAATVDCEPGIVLNCACNIQTSLNQLVREINGILGKEIQPRYLARRSGDVLHSYASISLARDAIGYVPRVQFTDGLRRTIDTYAKRI